MAKRWPRHLASYKAWLKYCWVRKRTPALWMTSAFAWLSNAHPHVMAFASTQWIKWSWRTWSWAESTFQWCLCACRHFFSSSFDAVGRDRLPRFLVCIAVCDLTHHSITDDWHWKRKVFQFWNPSFHQSSLKNVTPMLSEAKFMSHYSEKIPLSVMKTHVFVIVWYCQAFIAALFQVFQAIWLLVAKCNMGRAEAWPEFSVQLCGDSETWLNAGAGVCRWHLGSHFACENVPC